jgi:O-antigen/teichoic acid export membrane protein
VLKDRFLRGSALLFAAMMVGNVFGYLFQLAMGRMLSVAEYGEMNALMSLMVMFGIPLAALVNFFARETSVYFSKGDSASVRGLHRYGLTRTCWIAAFVICPLAFLSPFIGRYIGVSFDKVILVFTCVFVGALATVNTGVIQGMQYFRSLSFIGAGASFFKFAFAIVFVWFGWGVLGALGGLLATGLTLLVYSQWLILSSLPREKKAFHLSFGKIYKYVGGLFLANAFFGVLTQVDVMLVKHYFTPQEAGLYASAAILGKAVMYLPGAIVLALFPMAAANQAAGQSSSGMLIKAIGLTLALSGGGAVILHFFPGVIMGTLFGARYLPAAPLTAIFGLAMLPMALILVLMNYLLAQGRVRFVVFLAMAGIVELAGIHFFRNNLHNILYVIMAAGCMALFLMLSYILWGRWSAIRRQVSEDEGRKHPGMGG